MKLIWKIADEVYDCGDYLLVRRNGKETKVHLNNILEVWVASPVQSIFQRKKAPRATVTMRHPSIFGQMILFIPGDRQAISALIARIVPDKKAAREAESIWDRLLKYDDLL